MEFLALFAPPFEAAGAAHHAVARRARCLSQWIEPTRPDLAAAHRHRHSLRAKWSRVISVRRAQGIHCDRDTVNFAARLESLNKEFIRSCWFGRRS